jgi:hypothetical protein
MIGTKYVPTPFARTALVGDMKGFEVFCYWDPLAAGIAAADEPSLLSGS